MKLFYFILFYFIGFYSYSQNLVINASFENYDTCPYSTGQLEFANNAYNPNQASPDYFNECSSTVFSDVPNNFWGNQNAKTGVAYAAFGMNLNGGDIKEYITMELYDSLIIGKNYLIQFYVSLADNAKFSIYQVGAYIHDTLINQNNPFYLNFQPQIENPTGDFISDTLNWILIEGFYIAGGGEKFITIGNFYPDSLTDVYLVNSDGNVGCYYLDDVFVGEYIEPVFEENKLDIFPNPGIEIINFSYELKEEDAVLRIYNVIGQLVREEDLIGNNGTLTLDLFDLSQGMYFAVLMQNDEKLLVRKLMIIK